MAALLTIEAANTDKLAMYLGECRDLGVPILPPDINSSELAFTVEPRRRPLRPVRGQERRRGRDPVDARRAARSSGRIDSLYTLCEHVDLRLVNKRVLESLVKAARSIRWPGLASRRRRAGPGSSPPSTGRSSTADGISAIATRDRRSCSAIAAGWRRPQRDAVARRAGLDRERSSSRSRRRRSAST